jgi:L-threonylcarbamoyladenylate synthase
LSPVSARLLAGDVGVPDPEAHFVPARGRLPSIPLLVARRTAAEPGQFLKHYSPAATLLLFTGPRESVLDRMRDTARQLLAEGKTVGILTVDDEHDHFADLLVHIFPLGSELSDIARNLFTSLRELDSRGVNVILVHDVGREGLGLAIWDRLFRAAEGKVIDTGL